MDLGNNLCTCTGWEIVESRFDPDQIVNTGSNFLIGNGYLGYRGTLSEWDAGQYVACIVTDTYDMADGKWRELCNAPNGLYTRVEIGGECLSPMTGETLDYERRLDLRHGLFSRRQRWQGDGQKVIQLEVERFASYHNLHLVAMHYRFQAEQAGQTTVVTGIDGQVWSLNGEHFAQTNPEPENGLLFVEAITGEFGIQLVVAEGINIHGPQPTHSAMEKGDKRLLRRLTFDLAAGDVVELEKVMVVYSSNDVESPWQQARADAQAALRRGYQALKTDHQAEWDRIWSVGDIQIEGHLADQAITRFNLYHGIIATPAHAHLPIGARGLSCQAYQGAAFWDQEIYNLPQFLFSRPEVARNILEYRYVTLDGARAKARDLGYRGAFYAWVSGKTGQELCPSYFFQDVLSGRPIRNHFNDWQIHISPDVVYAIWHYYQVTGDWAFIVDYGAEIAFEVAQFLVSHAYYKRDKARYEFIRLLGPDEYHENVDNNAFTNYQARFALETALAIYERLKAVEPEVLQALYARLGVTESDVAIWREMVEQVYLPQPDPETLLIEQFDGYFDLEDTTPAELQKRLLDPGEYWGWPNGIAVETQVLKQSDVLQLFALHARFPVAVMRANYDYYEPRTQHGSSLSPAIHALVASRVGYADQAYRYFQLASTIDLHNTNKAVSGGTFIGGIHTAACGAVWQVIVRGFAGMHVTEDGLEFNPALPDAWQSVSFSVVYHDSRLEVKLARGEMAFRASPRNRKAVNVWLCSRKKTLEPGAEMSASV